MQEGIEIGMKQGMEKGMEKKGRTVIMNLLKLNMPIEGIAAATESPIPYVKEIAREAGYSVWEEATNEWEQKVNRKSPRAAACVMP